MNPLGPSSERKSSLRRAAPWIGLLALFLGVLLVRVFLEGETLYVLSFESEPSGASVSVNGAPLPGLTPLRNVGVQVPAEGVTVVMRRPGYDSEERLLTPADLGEKAALRWTLSPKPVGGALPPEPEPGEREVFITLRTEPGDATLCLGADCERRLAPVEGLRFTEAEGPLQVRASRKGYRSVEKVYSFQMLEETPEQLIVLIPLPGEKEPRHPLTPDPASERCWTLKVTTEPPGARLTLNGRSVRPQAGSVPHCGRGPVEICGSETGHERICETLPLKGEPGVEALSLRLPPKQPPKDPADGTGPGGVSDEAPAKKAPPVTLQVSAAPNGVQILQDGQLWGVAPQMKTLPAEGRVILSARREGYHSEERPVQLSGQAGQTIGVHFTLRELIETGRLVVRVSPASAEVRIDGRPVGLGPVLDLEVAIGAQVEVSAHAKGYQDERAQVTPDALRAGADVQFELAPIPAQPLDPEACAGDEAERWKEALKEADIAAKDLLTLRTCFAQHGDWGGVMSANERVAQDPVYGSNSMTYYHRGAAYLFWKGHEDYRLCFENLEEAIKLRGLPACSRWRAQVWGITCLDRFRTSLGFSERSGWPDPESLLRSLENSLGAEEPDDLSAAEFKCYQWVQTEAQQLQTGFESN